MKKYASIFVSALCMACVLLAVPTSVQVPQEIKPFIKADTTVLDVKSADLNGDGTQDYVLAVEHNLTNSESQEPIRTVVILEREKSGVLKIAAKSDHAILCKGCGGVFGDPFESLEAKKMQFSIHHFGGSVIYTISPPQRIAVIPFVILQKIEPGNWCKWTMGAGLRTQTYKLFYRREISERSISVNSTQRIGKMLVRSSALTNRRSRFCPAPSALTTGKTAELIRYATRRG